MCSRFKFNIFELKLHIPMRDEELYLVDDWDNLIRFWQNSPLRN